MLNPIALNRLCIIYLFCLLITSGCHLPTLDTPDCSGPKPDAEFSLSLDNCDQPCPEVRIAHTIVAGANYVWKLNGKILDRRPDFNSFNLSTPGPNEIRLVVTSNGGCVDSSSQFVTVSNIVRFKMVLPVSTANTTPLYATQRADGTYHCLYNQGGIRSVIVNSNLQVGSSFQFSTAASANSAIAYFGGFSVSRSSGNQAEIEIMPSAQTASRRSLFYFGGTNPSVGRGMCINGSQNIVITGYATASSKTTPGFGIFNANAGVVSTPKILSSTGGLSNYGGTSIVERPSGNYFLTAFQLSPILGADAQLLEVNASGNLIGSPKSLTPLKIAAKIIRLDGDFYAIIGRENSSPDKLFLMGINNSGTMSWNVQLTDWTTVSDLVYDTGDKTITICGTRDGKMYGARFSYTNSNATLLWEKSFNESVGSSAGLSVGSTYDGGYLFYGSYVNSGLTLPYLVKVDKMGNYK